MHKLFAPPVHAGAVHRQAILDRIFGTDCPRAVLVQAPAGHGKSTLLQQAKSDSEAGGVLTGWLTFDEADNDISRFFTHVQILLDSLGEDSPETGRRQGIAGNSRARGADWLINRLIALDAPVRLFFDEFQTLSNKSVLSFFANLLERIPDKVMIFIGSRTVPDIGLARLVVNNQALVLRAEDLRFSKSEVEAFFAQAGDLQMSGQEIQAIHGKTEGWPAALQLYRLSLSRSSVRESLSDIGEFTPRQLAEYLADNVLALQPTEVQDFLRQTSVLRRLSAPLCDVITGRSDSQQMLEDLERSGLFLRSLDSELYWFKFHTLFSSFLADQFRAQSRKAVVQVHRTAADWFQEAGHYEEAVYHAVAALDYPFAAQILDRWAAQLVMDGDLMTLERWSDRLPLDAIAEQPALAIKIAYALAFLRRRQKLGPILDLLEQQMDQPDAPDSNIVRSMVAIIADDTDGAQEIIDKVDVTDLDIQGFRAFELGAGANLKGYLALAASDFESAREYLTLARAHGDRAQAGFSWGYSVSTAGVNLMVQGMLVEALDQFRVGMAEPRISLDESVASASLVSCFVQALYECNDLRAAEAQFHQFHEVIANAALLDYLAVAYITMARIHDAEDRPEKALAILDEAEGIGHASMWPRLIRLIGWERVRRNLVAGETDRAHSIASRIPRERKTDGEWMPFSEDAEGDVIGEIRLAIHDNQPKQALKAISEASATAVRQGRIRRQIKLHILDAVAHRRDDADNAAHRSLRKALQLAAPGGFVRSFLDEGEAVIELLREDYQSYTGGTGQCDSSVDSAHAFVERILAASGAELEKSKRLTGAEFQPLEPLSEREEEILRLLANGLTNKEIAGNLFVSENTVKFHLKNIYSKLGVSSRLQATSAAREMGLFD